MKKYIILSLILLTSFWRCNNKDPNGPADIKRENNKIYIIDNTGKKWDVTHAFERYGMKSENYQYGLGPYAIQPINLPMMLSPGDAGYPKDNSTETVIGVNIAGDIRAYSIAKLSRHEVVNDVIGGVYVSVVY